jgi:hypothetical protein
MVLMKGLDGQVECIHRKDLKAFGSTTLSNWPTSRIVASNRARSESPAEESYDLISRKRKAQAEQLVSAG